MPAAGLIFARGVNLLPNRVLEYKTSNPLQAMKFITPTFFGTLAVLGAICIISSCSRNQNLAGAWEAAPERIAVADASDATSTVTLDFAPVQNRRTPGQVNISAVIELHQAAGTTSGSIEQPWEVSVAATATATGTYIYEDGDDDDILITIDPSSLTVRVDPDGVVYNDNVLTGAETAALDSMTAATASRWRVMLTPAIREQFNRYLRLDDVKVHHNSLMSAEIGHRDVTFRGVGR